MAADSEPGLLGPVSTVAPGLRVHSCILRCRAPQLHARLHAGGRAHLDEVPHSALQDLALFLYCERLPWDEVEAVEISRQVMVQRVNDLVAAAAKADVDPLARICTAWLALNGTHSGPGAATSADQEALALPGGSWELVRTGSILGQGLPGVVLADDIAKLVGSLDGVRLPCVSPDCVLVLGRGPPPGGQQELVLSDAARMPAHQAVLAARSGFFRAALMHGMSERSSGVVHLGVVEELGLWRPGESSSPVVAAFAALLLFLYSDRTDHVLATHAVDLLLLLQDDFLQMPEATALYCACEAALSDDLTIETAAYVARRAHSLRHSEVKVAALGSLARKLCCNQPPGTARQVVADFPRELLVDLVEGLVSSSAATAGCALRGQGKAAH